MDNQNNPNSPNNSNPPPFPTPATPTSPWSVASQAQPAPDPVPSGTPAWPSDVIPQSQTPLAPPPPPIPEPTAWTSPVPTPESSTPTQEQPITWTPPVANTAAPQPTFEPAPVAPAAEPNTPISPLDNPWGSTPQSAPLEETQPSIQPSWTAEPTPSLESIPTDLSHLISNNTQQEPAQPAPETLIVPSNSPTSSPDVSAGPAQAHTGIPKWLIGLGVGLLILVIGASAYFILGIGQPTKTTSLPAVTVPKTANEEVNPPQPVAATPTEQPASGSASFGALQGNVASSPQATSAAELLRQRQGR